MLYPKDQRPYTPLELHTRLALFVVGLLTGLPHGLRVNAIARRLHKSSRPLQQSLLPCQEGDGGEGSRKYIFTFGMNVAKTVS